jgi:hypothetical protein
MAQPNAAQFMQHDCADQALIRRDKARLVHVMATFPLQQVQYAHPTLNWQRN